MAIQRYEPFLEMISLQDAMNSLFRESFVRPPGMSGDGNALMLPLDVLEDENEFIVRGSLPGMRPEDIHITLHGNDVTFRGEIKADDEWQESQYRIRERRHGVFQRTVSLPTPISPDKAQAQFEDGVLTLVLPKAEEAKPKEIRIGGWSQPGARAQVGGQSQTGGQPQGGAQSRGGGQAQGSEQARPQTVGASSSS
jgi:HSP20 family protein